MAHVDANGIKFHVQKRGQGEPIVMVHGLLLGNLASWFFGPASALAETNEVIMYDLRGHGFTDQSPSGYDLETMVADLSDLISSQTSNQANEKISLVGHSYGAMVALHFALRFPERMGKLVLIEAPSSPGNAFEIKNLAWRGEAEIFDAFPDSFKAQLGSRQASKLWERAKWLVCETDLIPQLLREPPLHEPELRSMKIPIHLIYGTNSPLAPVAHRLKSLWPNASLDWLEGGHYLPVEAEPALSQSLRRIFTL